MRAKRRLERALTLDDLREMVKRRTPRAVFDYTDGAADAEISIARARQAFEDIEFQIDILKPATDVDSSLIILGGPCALPFGIAPTCLTKLMHTTGEGAGSRAAGNSFIPFTLSALGTATAEDVHAANPTGRNWFKLYVTRTREISYDLVRRASACYFDTLYFTVDTPISGQRLRDKRSGFSIPLCISPGTVFNTSLHPNWWLNCLPSPKLESASLASSGANFGELDTQAMDPTISYEDLDVIRATWPGKLVVKGLQTVGDAANLVDLGVDGILLSNHGGRQLDRAPVPFHLLPKVVREVGADATVMLDTGIMNGADIVVALAFSAKFALVGRAYLDGLMAEGASRR